MSCKKCGKISNYAIDGVLQDVCFDCSQQPKSQTAPQEKSYEEKKENLLFSYIDNVGNELLYSDDLKEFETLAIAKGKQLGREEREQEKRVLLDVGFYKGEMDFGVNCSVADLTYEQMKEFREMIIVAIGVAERMWKEEQSKKEQTGTKAIYNNQQI